MDINGIRLNNYRTLLLQFRAKEDKTLPEHGLLTRFAEAAGVSARYLSHINNGRKNIGDGLARQMETAFSLRHGWMDNTHEAVSEGAPDAERQFINAATALYRESPVEAQAMLLQYMLGRKAR